jgi:hypothetical protein
MPAPQFNPNASYDTAAPAFDPSSSYEASPSESAASVDTRNGVQKFVDNLTTVTPEQQKVPSWMNPAVGAVLNQAQKFGAGAIQGATAPFVHPQDTLRSVGNLIEASMFPTQGAQFAQQAIQNAAQNPAQTAGNLVGGAVLSEGAGALGEAMSGAARRTVLLGKTPSEAYESALKPSTTLSEAQRARMVQTGLENRIPVSKGGLETLSNRIDELNDAIKGEIAKDPNRPIDPNAVATRADQVKTRFANQVNAQPDLNAIEASKQQFLTEQGAQPATATSPAQPAPPMGAAKAQAMKQGTYDVLRGKYGEQGSATVEAQKALARGLKEEIATQFPEISNLNAAESKLLDLKPVLERAVNRISNHQLVGIGTPIAGAATKAITGSGSMGVVAATLKAVIDNPMVKSRLAISLSKGAQIPYSQALARVGAYSASLAATVGASQDSPGDQTPKE